MDSADLLAQARQLRPGQPGLIISGFPTAARPAATLEGVECLAKPFRHTELIEKIEAIVDNCRSSSAPSLAKLRRQMVAFLFDDPPDRSTAFW
jgi:hypothetical protein